MPAKKKAALPAYLEDFLAGLEAQALAGEELDRVSLLREVRVKHQIVFDPDAELKEHPDALDRYNRVMAEVYMGMEDAEINRVLKGKASAGPFLRMKGAVTNPGFGSGNGRLQLPREHRGKADRAW